MPSLPQLLAQASSPLYTWRPRPDCPEEFDEQTSFVESDALVSWMLGGNGSGKSAAGAHKAARFICYQQAPPRKNTPFWVISSNYDLSCGMGWCEKLSTIIPRRMVDRIQYLSTAQGYPRTVVLKPWPNGNNWVLEFKSYEQGRQAMQARSIGGAWFSEQCPMGLFDEVFRGAREYMFPGSIFGECTPIDPVMSQEIKQRYDASISGKLPGWKFFRLNTKKNIDAGGVSREWGETFFQSVSSELLETRSIGAFAGYEGVLFPQFNPAVHGVENLVVPPGCIHYIAIDWGASAQHPFACIWGAIDGAGRWYIYREYVSRLQVDFAFHAAKIKEIMQEVGWGTDSFFYRNGFADPSRPDGFYTFANAGIPVSPANNSVVEGIETIRLLLGDRSRGMPIRLLIDREKCPTAMQQMPSVRWVLGSEKGLNPAMPKPAVLKANDDVFDCIRYLTHTVRTRGSGGGITAVPKLPPRSLAAHSRR